MTLASYIAYRFFMAFVRVMVIICILIFVVEFAELSRSLADESPGVGTILHLTALKLPSNINQFFPLVLLLSSLSLFIGLSRSSELVISRAAGVSALRLLVVPVLVSLVIGVGFVAAFNPIVAATTKGFSQLRDQIRQENRSVLSVSQEGIWLRQVVDDRQTVIFSRRASADGSLLVDAEFHVFDKAGSLQERILADRAQIDGDQWVLSNLRRWDVGAGPGESFPEIERAPRGSVPTNLSSEQILDSFAPPNTISVWQLPGIIDQLEQSGFTAQRHKLFLQTALATPLTLIAMVLIGAGFSMRHVRFGRTGIMVLLSVLSGFALFSFISIANTLGAAGNIPIPIAAWAPPIAGILMTLGLLLHLEDG